MRWVILALVVGGACGAAENSCRHDSKNFRCVKYVQNYDADTITFDIPNVHALLGKEIRVRVRGVDAPEIRSKDSCGKTKAKQAKLEVEKFLRGAKRIDLKNVGRGKYFRIVADVVADGRSLTNYILTKKLGVPYDGGKKPKVNWCDPLP